MSIEYQIAFGQSCMNCIHCIPVNKHPWNTGDAKGKASEHYGYVCLMPIKIPKVNDATFFNDALGGCEMWERKIEEK